MAAEILKPTSYAAGPHGTASWRNPEYAIDSSSTSFADIASTAGTPSEAYTAIPSESVKPFSKTLKIRYYNSDSHNVLRVYLDTSGDSIYPLIATLPNGPQTTYSYTLSTYQDLTLLGIEIYGDLHSDEYLRVYDIWVEVEPEPDPHIYAECYLIGNASVYSYMNTKLPAVAYLAASASLFSVATKRKDGKAYLSGVVSLYSKANYSAYGQAYMFGIANLVSTGTNKRMASASTAAIASLFSEATRLRGGIVYILANADVYVKGNYKVSLVFNFDGEASILTIGSRRYRAEADLIGTADVDSEGFMFSDLVSTVTSKCRPVFTIETDIKELL